eukprot:CAMPEP_0113713684 /NCGR_PEP_ID=MMETSP0038_2-20120614/32148_1 /TAXON_ID=2898 /ORGANISM="Cryptomonas paramecium" /LENGTH=346 /DNA_ID=CAMNT_0000640477 /DNA_START=3 /DNA_END=1044 /DNA_ORIENTATION=+ /assembly_acc=CAM_ASM_000170
MAFVTSLFLFNIVNGWSGTAIYDSWIMVGFNALYTFLPPIVYGFMEQDVRAETAMSVPQLYGAGQRNENFNGVQLGVWLVNGLVHCQRNENFNGEQLGVWLVVWLGNGLVHCALVFGLPVGVAAASPDMDLGVLGTVVMWALSLVANLRLVLEEHRISVVSHAAVLVSVLVFYLWALLLNVAWALTGNFDTYYGVAMVSFGSGRAWLVVALTVVAMTGLDVASKYMVRTWRPDAAAIVQELERTGRQLPHSIRDVEACALPSPSAAAPSPFRGSALRAHGGGDDGVDVASKYMVRTWRPDAAAIVQELERTGRQLPHSIRDVEDAAVMTPGEPAKAMQLESPHKLG